MSLKPYQQGFYTATEFLTPRYVKRDSFSAFSRLAQLGLEDIPSTSLGSDSEVTIDYVAELVRAPSIDQAGRVVVSALVQKFARVLSGSSVEEIDVKKLLEAIACIRSRLIASG